MAGPCKNGGIGTHCYYLATFLCQRLNQDVTVLLTNHPSDLDLSHWQKLFAKQCGFRLESLRDAPPFTEVHYDRHYFHLVSLNTYGWLKEKDFDFCHFQDWNGNGFIPMQARRSGVALQDTFFTCTLHSPDEWVRQANRVLTHSGADDWLLDYMEQYSAKMADCVISPVNYMFNWVKEHGWQLPVNKQILPYLIGELPQPAERKFNPDHIVYFGRLETRKGLDIFVDSLKILAEDPKFETKNLKVTFLGRPEKIRGFDSLEYLHTAATKFPNGKNWAYLTDLDHFQALDYLQKNSDALVVIPSPVDNSPYTVIEGLQMNLNLIAAKAGGIPELVGSSRRLFTPNAKALAEKITEIRTTGMPPLTTKSYSREKSENKWDKFILKLIDDKKNKSKKQISKPHKELPKISITVSHFNLGRYLPSALKTLQGQTYENYEVIVIDDGSTENDSIQTFENLQKKYEKFSPKWKFIKKENKGLGHTRNFGAAQSDGRYLVFFDADNLAEKDMLESMVEAMENTQADCLSCFYPAFVENYSSDEDYNCCFMPFGACREIGIIENLFGDANFIIRREVFEKLGGFTEDPLTATHDWQFLAKLVLTGYDLDVIPKFLFKYRIRKDSMINTLDNVHSIETSIDPFTHDFGEREKKITLMANALDKEYRDKKHLIGLAEDQIRWMQTSLLSQKGQIDNFSKQTENFTKQTENLSEQIRNLHDEKKSLYSRLDDFWEKHKSLNSQLNEARVNINSLKSDIHSRNLKVNSLRSEVNNLNSRINSLRSEIESLNSKINSQTSEINSLNGEIRYLNLRLDYVKAELFESRDLAARLNADEFYRFGKYLRGKLRRIKRFFSNSESKSP